MSNLEYPRLVSIETTNRCNAKCPFCPNNALMRDRRTMEDALFEKLIDDCTAFPLPSIEPFLNGEPFVDSKIIPRMEYIRKKLPNTKLRIYTNGYALSPKKTDALVGLGIDHLYVSLNTLNPKTYRETMGFELEKTLSNMRYLTEPSRKDKIARKITFRMTRLDNTPLSEQDEFWEFCKRRGVRPFMVALFNYKGEVKSTFPVPSYPCEHITRLDVLSNGLVTLCCMDQEGAYSWGDATRDSILDIYHSKTARMYRAMHRTGRRKDVEPCGDCNVFWPSLDRTSLYWKTRFAAEIGAYFLKYKPSGRKKPAATPNETP